MSGNKDLMGLVFWMDNSKKSRLEAYMKGKQKLSKEKLHLMALLKNKATNGNQASFTDPGPKG